MPANKKKSATMKDVSDYSGFSLKTVSNVVNDWPYVSDETRQKVWDAIAAVGYRPNHMARSLVTGITNAIGVIIPDIANPFFGLAIRGCEDYLFQHEYSAFLCNSNEDIDREKFYLDLLMSRGIDGLILWGSRLNCSQLYEIVDEDVTLVTVDLCEAPTRANHTNIDVDSIDGARRATAHLIEKGRRHICHIQGPAARVTSDRRLHGYREAMAAAGLPAYSIGSASSRPSLRGGYRAACELFEQHEAVDAIFCYNDLMAVGAMLAARQYGRSIPDDLALVGFDNIAMASIVDPSLSTMDIAQYELGRLTGELVLSLMTETPANQTVLFPVDLRVRGSSERQTPSADHHLQTLEEMITALSSSYPLPAADTAVD